MHIVWQDFESGGELWLGGIGASGNLTCLLDNGITGIWPAAANPPVISDARLTDYGTCDGTGVMTGWDKLKEWVAVRVQRVIRDVLSGKKVLVSCRNGMHRSSTLMAIILMALTKTSADDVYSYLRTLRNIVQLDRNHPRQYTNPPPIPLHWLNERESELQFLWDGSRDLLRLCSPQEMEDLCKDLGLVKSAAFRAQDRRLGYGYRSARMSLETMGPLTRALAGVHE